MRFKEFSNEADNIRFIKLIFQRVLYRLNERYKKNLKIRKNKQRIAKQQAKNRKLLKHRQGSLVGVKKPDRPKR